MLRIKMTFINIFINCMALKTDYVTHIINNVTQYRK